MVKNSLKCFKTIKNSQKLSKTDKKLFLKGQKLSKTVNNGQNCQKKGQKQYLKKMYFLSFLYILYFLYFLSEVEKYNFFTQGSF